jgi:hypothetical protein
MPRQKLYFWKEEFCENDARPMDTEPAAGMHGLLLQPGHEKMAVQRILDK